MLSQILPGLREFRVPFTSGLLWLVGLWLVLRDEVVIARDSRLGEAVNDLTAFVDPLGKGVAVALLAYLVGALLEFVWSIPWNAMPSMSSTGKRAIGQLVDKQLDALPTEELLVFGWTQVPEAREVIADAAAEGEVARAFERRLCERAGLRLGGPPQVELLQAVAAAGGDAAWRVRRVLRTTLAMTVRDELDMVARQLIGKEQDVFQDYDRMRAESEFRLSVVVPTILVAIGLLRDEAGGELIFVVAALVLVVFGYQAFDRRAKAGDRVAGALRFGRVEAPSLQPVVPGAFTRQRLQAGKLPDVGIGQRIREFDAFGTSRLERFAQKIVPQGRYVDVMAVIFGSPDSLRTSLRAIQAAYGRMNGRFPAEWQRRVVQRVLDGEAAATIEVADELLQAGYREAAKVAYETPARWGYCEAYLRIGELAEEDGEASEAEAAFRRALLTSRDLDEEQAAREALVRVRSAAAARP